MFVLFLNCQYKLLRLPVIGTGTKVWFYVQLLHAIIACNTLQYCDACNYCSVLHAIIARETTPLSVIHFAAITEWIGMRV